MNDGSTKTMMLFRRYDALWAFLLSLSCLLLFLTFLKCMMHGTGSLRVVKDTHPLKSHYSMVH